jgi:hypothetical protein
MFGTLVFLLLVVPLFAVGGDFGAATSSATPRPRPPSKGPRDPIMGLCREPRASDGELSIACWGGSGSADHIWN